MSSWRGAGRFLSDSELLIRVVFRSMVGQVWACANAIHYFSVSYITALLNPDSYS